MRYITRKVGLWLLPVLSVCTSAIAEVPKAVLDRFELLSSFSVQYTRTTKHDPDPNLLGAIPAAQRAAMRGHVLAPEPRTERAVEQFRYAGERAEYTTNASEAYLESEAREGRVEIAQQVIVIGPDRGEQMCLHYRATRPSGSISHREEPPLLCFVDVAMGRRLMRAQSLLTAAGLRQMNAREEASGDVTLTWEDPAARKHTMRFAAEFGFALTYYLLEYKQPDTWDEVRCSDFQRIDDRVWVPFRIELDTSYRDTQNEIRHPFRSALEVMAFKLNPEVNKGDGLRMHWPKGSSVLDTRNGMTRMLTVQSDGEVLTDEKVEELLREKAAAESRAPDASPDRVRHAATQRANMGGDGDR